LELGRRGDKTKEVNTPFFRVHKMPATLSITIYSNVVIGTLTVDGCVPYSVFRKGRPPPV